MHELQQATCQNQHLGSAKGYIIQDWPKSRDQIPQDIRTKFIFRDDMAVTDRVIIKGRYVVVRKALQKQAFQQ